MKPKFIIKDWAGNICFNNKSFSTFEDAWGFIYDFYRDLLDKEAEECFNEYEVIKT